MSKILRDQLHYNDAVVSTHQPTLWARTQIIGGYGLHIDEKTGISQLDEVVFETENMVPLLGVQYAMEQLFGVKGPLTAPTLDVQMQIGAQSPMPAANGMPYPAGHKVCLFGVGTGGAGGNNLIAHEVKYNDINVSDMVPFRFTTAELSETDKAKYFGHKLEESGYHSYYLKRFDTDPVIRHLYKNGEDEEDGSEVDNTFFVDPGTFGVQSFTEMCLTISRKDVREYFQFMGNIEECRVNSIGLFSAIYDPIVNDYSQIQLFSKLNIPTEPLSLSKDMNILYRVYGA